MYAKGMTTSDIESHMKELYDMDISDSTISRIADKILPINGRNILWKRSDLVNMSAWGGGGIGAGMCIVKKAIM